MYGKDAGGLDAGDGVRVARAVRFPSSWRRRAKPAWTSGNLQSSSSQSCHLVEHYPPGDDLPGNPYDRDGDDKLERVGGWPHALGVHVDTAAVDVGDGVAPPGAASHRQLWVSEPRFPARSVISSVDENQPARRG